MDHLPRRRREGGGEIVEVYGFAGWITTLVAYAFYLVWAYVPESTLHTLGITYYPSKYWAIAIPSATFVTVTLVVLLYIAANFMSTAPLDSFDTITVDGDCDDAIEEVPIMKIPSSSHVNPDHTAPPQTSSILLPKTCGTYSSLSDMHAREVTDRASVWAPDSNSKIPPMGDLDIATVNRVLYKNPLTQSSSQGHQGRRRRRRTPGNSSHGGSAGEARGQRL